jgi:Arc/MetJ-type ribon-helix-helix transcriptional regulator
MEAQPPPLTSLTIHLSTPAVEEISRLVESRAGSDASDVVEKMLLSVLPSFRELHARYAASAAAAPPPAEEGDEVDDAGADEAAAAAARRPHFFKNIQSIDPSGKAHWRPEDRGPARGVRPAPSPLTPLPSLAARRKRKAKFCRGLVGLMADYGMDIAYVLGVVQEMATDAEVLTKHVNKRQRLSAGAARTAAADGDEGPGPGAGAGAGSSSSSWSEAGSSSSSSPMHHGGRGAIGSSATARSTSEGGRTRGGGVGRGVASTRSRSAAVAAQAAAAAAAVDDDDEGVAGAASPRGEYSLLHWDAGSSSSSSSSSALAAPSPSPADAPFSGIDDDMLHGAAGTVASSLAAAEAAALVQAQSGGGGGGRVGPISLPPAPGGSVQTDVAPSPGFGIEDGALEF